MVSKRYGIIIDQERCIGCEACTVACRIENKGQSGWIPVKTLDSANKDMPFGTFPNLKLAFLPELCNHCQNPPCVDVCPLGALEKQENGIVSLSQDACDGCQVCMEACPYDQALFFNSETNKVEKCGLCAHRIDDGLEPFCVTCCEGQAMHFGDLSDPDSPAAKLAGQENAFQLKPDSGTGPNIFYLPQKAPRGL